MSLSRPIAVAVLSLAALLSTAGRVFADVNFVAPGIAGSVSNLTVGALVYDVTFVGTVTHAQWANQLDFSTEAEAEAAIVALAAALNAAGATATQFVTGSGTHNLTTSTVWYASNGTSLFGETLIKVGSNWQLAFPFPGGATAPLNNSFPIALDFTLVSVPTWTNLGSGLAGISGIPSLVGTGTLMPSAAGSLALSSAKPSSPAVLFVSFANTPSPFKGGTLITVPVVLALNLGTDVSGGIALPFAWPAAIPSATTLYFQCAIQDAAGPQGASLSNALKAVTP